MARLIENLDAERIRANVARVRAELDAAARRAAQARPGGEPREVELLAAIKYIRDEDLPLLAEAGVELVGENRAQELQAKHAAHGELFEWDFIGQLQSRRVREIVPLRAADPLRRLRVGPARARALSDRSPALGCAF